MATKLFVFLASLFFIVSPSAGVQTPFTISGTIKDKTTGAPIRYVHVFTVKGEEEAITDAKGAFTFQTWRLSAELTTEKEGYHKNTVDLKLPAPAQTILLTKE